MRILYLLFIIVAFGSCNNDLPLKTNVILSGKMVEKISDSLKLVTDSRFKYYKQEEVSKSIELIEDGSFRDTLVLEEGHYELQYGSERIKLFLKPGNHLQLILNKGIPRFAGEGAKDNYYIQERDSLIAKVGGNNFYQYFSNLPEKEFLRYADSLEKQRLDLIDRHPNIDQHLQKSERLWANVEKAHKFHNYSFTRVTVDTSYAASVTYPDPLAQLDINDEDLLHVSLFPMLLYSTFGKAATEDGLEEWEYFLKDSFPIQNPEIKEVAFYTSAFFSMSRFKKLDEFFEASQNFLTDAERKETITNQYLDLKNLSAGQPAPAFSLENMQGEPVDLEDLQGDVVYIDFWASWCRPCLNEIPAYNKLQKKYEKENISFVSIGIESKKESLQKLIEVHQLRGIQIFDPEKEEELKKAYAVGGIPHYILIDRHGNIVEHQAKRPSDPQLIEQLDNLLK